MNFSASARSVYGPQEKKRTTSGSRPRSNSASASSGRGGRRLSRGPSIRGIALEPERRAVAPEPALVLLVVGHAASDHPPEPRRVVEHLEVRHLVHDAVVEDLLRAQQQPPVEAHRAVRGAGGPPGALLADRQARVAGARPGHSVVEPPLDLVAGLAPVPALERVAKRLASAPGHLDGQDVAAAADVRARAPR